MAIECDELVWQESPKHRLVTSATTPKLFVQVALLKKNELRVRLCDISV
jgi:hypothetical protein